MAIRDTATETSTDLINNLKKNDPLVREQEARALGKVQDTHAVDARIASLEDIHH